MVSGLDFIDFQLKTNDTFIDIKTNNDVNLEFEMFFRHLIDIVTLFCRDAYIHHIAFFVNQIFRWRYVEKNKASLLSLFV